MTFIKSILFEFRVRCLGESSVRSEEPREMSDEITIGMQCKSDLQKKGITPRNRPHDVKAGWYFFPMLSLTLPSPKSFVPH